ncbi:F-box/kelch-repeat protein at1g55270, partial [Phtheirospermum japonicum]
PLIFKFQILIINFQITGHHQFARRSTPSHATARSTRASKPSSAPASSSRAPRSASSPTSTPGPTSPTSTPGGAASAPASSPPSSRASPTTWPSPASSGSRALTTTGSALGFGCAVLSGCHLYLFGGKDPLKGSMRRVVFYSARTNKWHRAPDMLRKRHFFGSCVINNCLYVAGGECEGIQRTLRSAEVYDPNRNRWTFIADMSTAMVPFIGVVYDGRWFLKGLGAHREVLSEAYTPARNSWSPINDGMVSGWRNPSISMNGKLYALDCRDGCKLRVYDENTDSWSRFIDSKVHLGNSRALEAAALVALNGKLCIIRNNMSISMVDVSDPDRRVESNPQIWENIGGKGHIRNLFTNLWSSIAGRSGLKSHIVHCQVLQA